jgi:hypothetical protein
VALNLRVATLAGLALLATAAGPAPRPKPTSFVILPPAMIPDMLRQCSRGAPAKGEGGWLPAPADIAALEMQLPKALIDRHIANDLDWAHVTAIWDRQYVGIVRGGRRFVYGNFFPHGLGQAGARPVGVCDGGPQFFGVEYDVAARRFTRLDFNGSV